MPSLRTPRPNTPPRPPPFHPLRIPGRSAPAINGRRAPKEHHSPAVGIGPGDLVRRQLPATRNAHAVRRAFPIAAAIKFLHGTPGAAPTRNPPHEAPPPTPPHPLNPPPIWMTRVTSKTAESADLPAADANV